MVHAQPARKKSNATNGNSTPNHCEMESELPVPPDGGWGWMVVFGSFMIHIMSK